MEEKNLELTKEQLEALNNAGAIGFDLEATFLYVPKAYRTISEQNNDYLISKELWPVFKLKSLDGVQSAIVEDEIATEHVIDKNGNTSFKLKSGKQRISTLCKGIISWKNFRDSKGNLIPSPEILPIGEISENALKRIPPKLQNELTNAITERCTLNDNELLGLE